MAPEADMWLTFSELRGGLRIKEEKKETSKIKENMELIFAIDNFKLSNLKDGSRTH